MVERLFEKFDVGGAGRLGQQQYKAYLAAIGAWGQGGYTEAAWAEKWPAQCARLETTEARGVDRAAFELLYRKHRAAKLVADFARAVGAGCTPYVPAYCPSSLLGSVFPAA